MYRLGVKNTFIAQHFLIGGDFGPENQEHSHRYSLELQIKGDTLDKHGYLLDIVEVKQHLEKLISRYQDRTLNHFPEFKDLNPSLENLARIFHQSLLKVLFNTRNTSLKVKVWEDEIAWVSYQDE